MIIKPTVGRIVYFWHNALYKSDEYCQPQAAMVTYVFNDRMINIVTFDHSGNPQPLTSVELVQEGDTIPTEGCFCEWMPYQIGQAKQQGAYMSPEAREKLMQNDPIVDEDNVDDQPVIQAARY